MGDFSRYLATPAGSLVYREREEEWRMLGMLVRMPLGLYRMLMSLRTGAFLRGTMREFDLPVESEPRLAFEIFRIAVGESKLENLRGWITNEFGLINEKAQAMAKEIERELFAPVMLELQQFLQQQQSQSKQPATGSSSTTLPAQKTPGLPPAPPMPRK